jgi:hypothetical protein
MYELSLNSVSKKHLTAKGRIFRWLYIMKNSFFLRSPGSLIKIKNLIFVKILATDPGTIKKF